MAISEESTGGSKLFGEIYSLGGSVRVFVAYIAGVKHLNISHFSFT